MKKDSITFFASTVAILLIAGCSTDNTKKSEDSKDSGQHVHADGTVHKNHSKNTHSHGNAPHGGTIADWGGGEYHIEFCVDHDKKEATVYILGGDAKTAAAIEAQEISLAIKDPAFQVTLKASPQEGDGEGKASRFVGNHENLGIVKEYEGAITGVVGGTPYSGSFKEEPHPHD